MSAFTPTDFNPETLTLDDVKARFADDPDARVFLRETGDLWTIQTCDCADPDDREYQVILARAADYSHIGPLGIIARTGRGPVGHAAALQLVAEHNQQITAAQAANGRTPSA